MSGQHDDDIHDEHLSHIYRQGRTEQPPLALDSAILSQARKAVEKRKPRWNLSDWLMPLTATAITLLTATLFIQMRHEHPEAVAPTPVEEAAPALKSAPGNEGVMKEELRQRKAEDAMQRKPAAPAPAAAPARMAEPSAAGMAEPKQKLTGRSQLQEKDAEKGAVVPLAVMPAEDRAVPGAAPGTGKIPYPESWLAKIRELLKQGKKDAARRESEAFRAAYPDRPLPEDIVAALK